MIDLADLKIVTDILTGRVDMARSGPRGRSGDGGGSLSVQKETAAGATVSDVRGEAPSLVGDASAHGEKKDRDSSDAPLLDVDENTLASLRKDLQVIHQVDLTFAVHESTGRRMIRVIDSETGALIREIPPEALLNIKAKLAEFKGQLINRSV